MRPSFDPLREQIANLHDAIAGFRAMSHAIETHAHNPETVELLEFNQEAIDVLQRQLTQLKVRLAARDNHFPPSRPSNIDRPAA